MSNSPLEFKSHLRETISPEDSALSLRSGPGAPIFEPGPHTRIRRNPTRAFAAMTWEGGPREVFGQVLNISLSGCLLRTESTIKPGTVVAMTITVLGAGNPAPLEVSGVVRRQTLVDGRRAYGVELLGRTKTEKETNQYLYAQTAQA